MIALARRSLVVLAVLMVPQLTEAAPPDRNSATAAASIAPRGSVVISGPELRLGDLFTNVGDKADRRVGTTPPAGTPLTVDATTLQRLANLNGLPWRATSTQDRTVVERDSVLIGTDEIIAGVLMVLAQKGTPTEGLEVDLTLGSRQYYRPREGAMQIDAVSVDATGLRFAASMSIVTPGEARQTVALTGRMHRTVEVPVLTRPLRAGDVIDARAIGSAQLPDRQVSANAVRDRGALLGQSVRRALAVGAPILVSDLQPTNAVSKGQSVLVLLQVPGMQLSVRGVALDAGAVGETIRVQNERTKATVQGVVADNGTVHVLAAGR